MFESVIESALGVAKESIKTFTQEAFNNTIKLINGISAILLTLIPGKTQLLEGIQGWELHPTFRAARMPRWMETGVSSFNEFIHDYTAESDSESESEYESGLDDDSLPASPSSQTSHLSRTSSFSVRSSRSSVVRRVVRLVFWPLIGWRSRDHTSRRRHSRSGSSGSFTSFHSLASRRLNSMRDYVMTQTADSRRRGIVEDLQLLMELSIEKSFEVVRNVLFYMFSPIETVKTLLRKLLFHEETVLEQKTVLGDGDPSPTWREAGPKQRLNTDARTCRDIITDLGYPYEALRVTTEDGYVLLLERIPRKDSQKVVYLQHGLFDSSLGWVSNGVVGSQAFAAYDQGYDVFLGNFRGLVSREHVNKGISSERYWRYSVNEHGMQDIPAMINKIHELKTSELQQQADVPSDIPSSQEDIPYRVCGICHSLGGAAMLMYVVTARLEGRPHRLSRIILLSPAGFHEDAPGLCYAFQYIFPYLAPVLRPLVPGIYIPTKFLRMVFNKLARDFQNYPALGGLVQLLCGSVVGGDSSNWVAALGMTHYNMDDMPGVSYTVAEHLAQMMRSKRFIMYDFGSAEANKEAYGTPEPLDVAANYDVIDIPVDLVAGKKDKLIPKSMVRKHYEALKAAGVQVSYQEYEYAHLDFTFAHREELLAYVMSRLLLVDAPENKKKYRSSRSMKKSDSKKLNATPLNNQKERSKTERKTDMVNVSEDGEVVTKEDVSDREQFMDGPMFAYTQRDILNDKTEGHDSREQKQVFASAGDCLEGLNEDEVEQLAASVERD